jgi:hypothetical protein
MAGFEVIIYGRFWVIAEGSREEFWINAKSPSRSLSIQGIQVFELRSYDRLFGSYHLSNRQAPSRQAAPHNSWISPIRGHSAVLCEYRFEVVVFA